MLKEQSRKWKLDDKKVMNWEYHVDEDYYINPQNVRFNFSGYRKRTGKERFTRVFKEYRAEKLESNVEVIPEALTLKGYVKRITVNPTWEYYKAKQKALLSSSETGKIYNRKKLT